MEIDLQLLLNLPHIEVTDFSMTDTEAHIHCKSLLDGGYCALCLSKTSSVTMYQERMIRDMPLLGRIVYLHLKTRQFHCQDCYRYFNEGFDFVEPSKNLTIRYETYLYKMSENISIPHCSSSCHCSSHQNRRRNHSSKKHRTPDRGLFQRS
jgi:transposase